MDKKNPYKAINDPGISMPNYIDACASLDQIQCIMNDLGTEGIYLGNVNFSKVPNVSGEGVKSRTSCLATSLGTHGAGCDMQGLYNNMYRSINLGINQNFNGKKTNIDFVKEYQKYKEAYEEYQKNPDEQGKDFLQTLAYSMFLDAANNLNKNGTYQGQGKNGESLYIVRGENGDYVVAEKDGKIVNVLDVDGTNYSYSEDGTSTAIENNGTGIKGMFTSDGVKYTTKDSKTGKEVDITGLVTGSIPTDKDSSEYKTIVENAKTVLDGALDKDSSKWTIAEKMAAALYYRDLSDRTQEEEQKANENAGWATDELSRQSIFGKYDELSVEKNELEGKLKEAGILEYTDKEKGQIELAAAKERYKEASKELKEARKNGNTEEVERLEKELEATRLIIADSGVTGVKKIGEGAADAGSKLIGILGTPLTKLNDLIFGTNITGELWDSVYDDVAVDRTGDERREKYETSDFWRTANETSPVLKYDGAGADLISGTVTRYGGDALTAGATLLFGPFGLATGSVISGLSGSGRKAEELYNIQDENGNYTYRNLKGNVISTAEGVQSFVEAYGIGKLTGGLAGMGDLKIFADGVKTSTGDAFTDALINVGKNSDYYVFQGANIAGSVQSKLEDDDWNLIRLATQGVAVFGGTAFAEYMDARAAAKGNEVTTSTVKDDSGKVLLSDDELDDIWGGASNSSRYPKIREGSPQGNYDGTITQYRGMTEKKFMNKQYDEITSGGTNPQGSAITITSSDGSTSTLNSGVFLNNRGDELPFSRAGYKEFDVEPPYALANGNFRRTERRIIINQGNGNAYYTNWHYRNFYKIPRSFN